MKRAELFAKSSAIHTIIDDFNKSLGDFYREVGQLAEDIDRIAGGVEWGGVEADNFKNEISNSVRDLQSTLGDVEPIQRFLNEKSAEWARILAKIKGTKLE